MSVFDRVLAVFFLFVMHLKIYFIISSFERSSSMIYVYETKLKINVLLIDLEHDSSWIQTFQNLNKLMSDERLNIKNLYKHENVIQI